MICFENIHIVCCHDQHFLQIYRQSNISGTNLNDISEIAKTHRKRSPITKRHFLGNRKIPQDFIRSLIGSMRRRCQAVIYARGGHTRYCHVNLNFSHVLLKLFEKLQYGFR